MTSRLREVLARYGIEHAIDLDEAKASVSVDNIPRIAIAVSKGQTVEISVGTATKIAAELEKDWPEEAKRFRLLADEARRL